MGISLLLGATRDSILEEAAASVRKKVARTSCVRRAFTPEWRRPKVDPGSIVSSVWVLTAPALLYIVFSVIIVMRLW